MPPSQQLRFSHRFLPVLHCAQISIERARHVWVRNGDNLYRVEFQNNILTIHMTRSPLPVQDP